MTTRMLHCMRPVPCWRSCRHEQDEDDFYPFHFQDFAEKKWRTNPTGSDAVGRA